MDLDAEIANCILEQLLQKPLNDPTLKSLLHDNPGIKKRLLLKKLELDISHSNSVFEDTLELLGQLAELETPSETMKQAFFVTAMECIVKNLQSGDGEGLKGYGFFDAVKDWRRKVERMKGLSSEPLSLWRQKFETAVFDDEAACSLLKECEGFNGVEAVKGYIKEEREKANVNKEINKGKRHPPRGAKIVNCCEKDGPSHKKYNPQSSVGDNQASSSGPVESSRGNMSSTQPTEERLIIGTEQGINEQPRTDKARAEPSSSKGSSSHRFEIVFTDQHKHRLYLYKDFALAAGLKRNETVKCVGVQYSCQLTLHQYKRSMYVMAGWNAFWRNNNLRLGKTLSFDFNPSENAIHVEEEFEGYISAVNTFAFTDVEIARKQAKKEQQQRI